MIPPIAQFKPDVAERYLRGRDESNPEIAFWAGFFSSFETKDAPLRVLAIEPSENGNLVTIDISMYDLVMEGKKIDFMTIEEDLVTYPNTMFLTRVSRAG